MGGSAPGPQPALTSAAGRAGSMPAVAGGGELVMLARTGLQLPARLPFERWLAIGMQLSAVSASAAWCLGDWLAFGEQAYTSRYRDAIELTSLDYQTLRNYAWVARRFSVSRRRDTLSFTHHSEVAALPQPEQDFWLRKAEQHHWPVRQLRREVRASLAERSAVDHEQPSQDPDEGEGGWINLKLHIRMPAQQLAACQAQARKLNVSIQDWATQILGQASGCYSDGTDIRPRR